MVWTFMGNARMYQTLSMYGDRISQVGLFSFKVDKTGVITESGVAISNMLPYIHQWPHIKWLLTISNEGTNSIFKAIRENTSGAQDTFLSEVIRIMKKYQWCDGIDIDLERGDGYSTHAASTQMFAKICNTVKSYDNTKHMNICLPGMTSVNGSVGGENWCVYADLNPYCDTAAIMSYGMAWAGSAPGPVSPRDWLEGIYDYAVKAMTPDKVFLGLPAYGWNWQIDDTPENLGKTYRGTSNTYYAAKNWMTGKYNFTDDKPPQPFIPILAYWDDYDKVPWALPQVYDFMEGKDAAKVEYPLMNGTYNRRNYLTAYNKEQKTAFHNVTFEHDASGGSYSGVVSVENGVLTLGDEGTASYTFSVSSAENYDIAVKLCYPFWDKNGIYISIDGNRKHFSENRLWWPYWRSTFWTVLASGINLLPGTHTIKVSVDVKDVQFYGYKVCSAFTEAPSAGEARFTLSPRHFIDVDGKECQPDRAFKLTCEMLRRKPDSALIWYEDFRDYGVLKTNYWQTLSGAWTVWREDEYSEERVYSQLDGSGQLAWQYDGFLDVHLRARLAFPSSGSGKAGVFCGGLFCCLNVDSQAVELYYGNTLLGSYSQTIERTANSNLRTDPSMYTVEMRIRRNKVRIYTGSSYTLRFTATLSGFPGGHAGYRSDHRTVCELLRMGDAWTYEPYERFDVTFPDGTVTQYGRISRSNVTWDSEFQVFTVTSDIEESATRSENISLDYEFYHSHELDLSCGSDYMVTITPMDINIWIARLFLGDADGFSILYYQDVDSLIYWANEAAYRWGVRGFAMWSLGQEDMRLWEALPKQI
jgi:spore germination protein YaaH